MSRPEPVLLVARSISQEELEGEGEAQKGRRESPRRPIQEVKVTLIKSMAIDILLHGDG